MNLWKSCRLGAVLLLLAAAAAPATADVIVLDADDVIDWARVYSAATWKQKDACLHPNALIKFDLGQVFDPTSVLSARLDLFLEQVQPGEGIELWHVLDDGWSYAHQQPIDLWDWPVNDWIGTRVFDDTTSFSVDVTDHVREEGAIAGQEFSVKIVAAGIPYPHLRIASPLAPIERMRPRLVVEFLGPPAPPPVPDLAVSPADLRLVPMRPVPGQSVTIEARVRNIGAETAWNVPVAFYDGEPTAGNPPIGIWIIPHLPPGGGSEQTSVLWTANRGLHEIHVVADFEGVVSETDESNNAAFRPFLVADDPEYANLRESFEFPGRVLWHADFDVPKQFEYPGPKSFYVNHANGEAYHGEHAIELYLDGTADDGTIWLETAVPVEPQYHYDAQIDFELFRYQPDMAFEPVVAVTLFDPEEEGDFEVLQQPAETGWTLHSYRKIVFTGPYDMLHLAVGLTCTWETPGTFFLDLVRASVLPIPAESAPDGETAGDAATTLLPGRPNPFRNLATIAYRLSEPGPVSLEVFDTAGRLLSTLREGRDEAGLHRVSWNGADRFGRALPSGVYLYRLRTAAGEQSRKLLLAR